MICCPEADQKDWLHVGHDYEDNSKAELESMLLHQKLDELHQVQWAELLVVGAVLASAKPG